MVTNVNGIATDFITFSRASNATVTNNVGLIGWAPHNLLLSSEQFDNTTNWTRTGLSSVAANSIEAPNGTITADKIVENTATSAHAVTSVNIAVETGATYVASVFCKPAGRDFAMFQFNMGGVNSYAIVNLTTATFGAPTNVAGSATFSATALSNGWVQLRATATTLSSAAGTILIYAAINATTFSYLGDGTSGVYLWGGAVYRSDLAGMQPNASTNPAYSYYNSTTPKNLLGYSEDFSNAYWSRAGILAFGSGSATNITAAPNGLFSADLITPDTSNGYHVFYGASLTLSGGVATHSIYVKPNGYTKVALRENGPSGYYATFNLIGAGSVLDNTATYATPAVTALTDGWYRISVRITNATTQQFSLWILPDSYTTGTPVSLWTANGVNGVYVWGAQLSDSASIDAYSPSLGAAPSAAAYYGPRRDFSPTTLACNGLLVEEQRTNLTLRSQEFENAYWTKLGLNAFGSGSVANTTATRDPTGLNTADFIQEDTANSTHTVYLMGITLTAVPYTYSVYCKSAGRNWAYVRLTATTGQGAYFNLSNGTIGTIESGVTASITSVGNGWYRCSVTVTASAATWYPFVGAASADNTSSYLGDGVSGLYIWGSQLEAGPFATSYIPTVASTVTRSADVASVYTAQFPYSQSEGSVIFSGVLLSAAAAGKTAWQLFRDNNERILVQADNGAGALRHLGFVGGSAVAVIDSSSVQTLKDALAYKLNDYAVSINGGAVLTDTSAAVPAAANVFEIGSGTGNPAFNGHIRQITYLPRRISNTDLQTRST